MIGKNRLLLLGTICSGDQSDALVEVSTLAQGMVIRTRLQPIHSFRATIADEDGFLGDVSEVLCPLIIPRLPAKSSRLISRNGAGSKRCVQEAHAASWLWGGYVPTYSP